MSGCIWQKAWPELFLPKKSGHSAKLLLLDLFKFRKFNLLISDYKIERYEPSLQTG